MKSSSHRGTALLVIDVGTTALKAAIVDRGNVVRSVEIGYEVHTERPGWVEQDPADWWAACIDAVRQLDAAEIGAIAVTGQMQDLITIDDHGLFGRAILYSDQRATEAHRQLNEELDGWAEAVGGEPDATNVAAKWRWLAEHQPERVAQTRTALFGAHSAIVWQLTGRTVCDPSTAASTGLFAPRTMSWWDPVVATTSIPLPELCDPTTVVGDVRSEVAKLLGVPAGIPVVHASGDAVATTVGVIDQAIEQPYAYVGTSGWVASATSSRGGGAAVWLPGIDADHWVAAAPILTAGAAVDWARHTLFGGLDSVGFDRLAGSSCAAATGLLFLPYLDGVRTPLASAAATGVLIGAQRSTERDSIAAAVYEGVAHAIRASAAAITGASAHIDAMILCGGLSRSNTFAQIVADVLDAPVRRVADEHATLRGAAVSAAAAVGAEPMQPAKVLGTFQPRAERAAAHRRVVRAFDGLSHTLGETFTQLASVRLAGGDDGGV